MTLEDIDLYFNQYDEKILIENIKNLTPIDIIKTQKNLSKDFIKKYILANDEDDITMSILNMYQPNFFIDNKE